MQPIPAFSPPPPPCCTGVATSSVPPRHRRRQTTHLDHTPSNTNRNRRAKFSNPPSPAAPPQPFPFTVTPSISTPKPESTTDTRHPHVKQSAGQRPPQTKPPAHPSLHEQHALDHRKKAAQQAYLAKELEKRHLEKRHHENNSSKSASTRSASTRSASTRSASTKSETKNSKRVRTSSRFSTSPTTALKDSFQAYMNEISREQLLGQAEIFSLANRIKQSVEIENTKRELHSQLGRTPTVPQIAENLNLDPKEVQKRLMAGMAAKNSLVSANLRLVTSVARKVASGKGANKTGLGLEDMVQEGSVGLIRAAEKFDATRGYKFSTYASWWIRAYVMRSISTQSRSIKVPSTIVDEYARIRKEYARFRDKGIFKPRESEVARGLGITTAKLRFVVNVVTQVPTSLDLRLNPGGDSTNPRSLSEIVPGDDHIEERMVEELAQKELDQALRDHLRPLERAVIRLRFGLDDGQSRTLRETGELLDLSKERIRQIIFRALPKLKTPEIQRMLTDATSR